MALGTAAGRPDLTRGRLIGLVAPEVQSDFYATIANVLATRCAAAGAQLVLALTEDDPELEQRQTATLRAAGCGGLVITPTSGLTEESAAVLDRLPVVQVIRSSPRLDKPWVGIDDRIGVQAAARYLLDLGHRRIGFIGGHEALTTGRDRLGGYESALAAAGVTYDESLVALGPPRVSFGAEAATRLTQLADPITALVLGSSQLTHGALHAIQQRKLPCPAGLSVVGYGDPEWFRLWGPGLTTIGLPAEDIAASAAQVLFSLMAGLGPRPGEARRGGVVFQPYLIERGSVAPMPGSRFPVHDAAWLAPHLTDRDSSR